MPYTMSAGVGQVMTGVSFASTVKNAVQLALSRPVVIVTVRGPGTAASCTVTRTVAEVALCTVT